MDVNHLTSSKEDFIPSIIEWGRLDATTNEERFKETVDHEYDMTSAGGDCFALPIKNFKSHTHPEGAEGEYDDFILLDSGRPGAFVHILHFLNIETPLTRQICGNDSLSAIYSHSSTGTRPRRIVGVICTHEALDHSGGIAVLLALGGSKTTKNTQYLIDNTKTELRVHSSWKTTAHQNLSPEMQEMLNLEAPEWRSICKDAIKDIEFILCPDVSSRFFSPFVWDGDVKAKDLEPEEITRMFKKIFEQTCGQVLLKQPKESSLRYWSRTNAGTRTNKNGDDNTPDPNGKDGKKVSKNQPPLKKEISRSVALRLATNISSSPRPEEEDPQVVCDRSSDNSLSLITCYIGSYCNKQVHYVFGGDGCEDVVQEVRARLPPNRYCFDELLRKTKNAGVDIFKPEATDARKSIGKLMYGAKPYAYTSAEQRWDMFQLNHHGSIKNVLNYGNYTYPSSEAHFVMEIATQLCSKARGFFATSPGTRCHADVRIHKALCERDKTQPSVYIVHMAYPTICTSGAEHTYYIELKATGFLETNFPYTPSPVFAAPLIPFPSDPERVKERIYDIVYLIMSKSSRKVSDHFVHPSDPHFQGFTAASYHMLQAHRFLKLMDPIVLCLESAEHIISEFPDTTRWLLRVTTAILHAFDQQLETWDIDKLLSFEPNAAPEDDDHDPEKNMKLSYIHLLMLQCCNQWMFLQTEGCFENENVIHLTTALKSLLLDVADKCVKLLSSPNPKASIPNPDEKSCEDEQSDNWTSFVSSPFARCSKTDAAQVKTLLSSIEGLWDILVDRCGKYTHIRHMRTTNSPVPSSFKRIKTFASLIQPLREKIDEVLKFVDESDDECFDMPRTLRRKLLGCVQSMATILSKAPALSFKPITNGLSMYEQAKQYVQSIFLNKSARTHSEAVVKAMTAAKVNSRIQDCFTQIHATVDTEFDRLVDVMNNQWEIVDEEDVEEKAE